MKAPASDDAHSLFLLLDEKHDLSIKANYFLLSITTLIFSTLSQHQRRRQGQGKLFHCDDHHDQQSLTEG